MQDVALHALLARHGASSFTWSVVERSISKDPFKVGRLVWCQDGEGVGGWGGGTNLHMHTPTITPIINTHPYTGENLVTKANAPTDRG